MPLPLILRHLAALRVLLLLTACDEGDTRNINFHNLSPPVDATPFPRSFKCFTCEQESDNYNCNRWAEDKWCPENTRFCMTVHRFSSYGKSRSVTKRCAAREDCLTVGCRHHRDTDHTECVSCCEGMVCNVEVPTNHSNAVLALRHAQSSSVHLIPAWKPPSFVALVTLAALMLW
ncbi:ly6/PLAUR domain-containing protein 6B [Brienomyrus brachyistius]|uniref:ly6/PLAUR domain-containing protein 6B n=1 Tax=Brienomyrus brachyistius TaxID=42636 RepID=UPI0020B42C14|nr:ly6/PLAUR domain-containing protein 6B [Brienomyrus brachyistius]XP_048880387.1 ly6/PLAUR domain-containing protein 6B [Brienomyrus brachyistius]XP_048880394.1 ly6/PLAUR domain-containing protein 6B [Brienomyrus brachyistius]XP_048880400.1 ly6/PLAUR domain-containing protein 6B [Brienomyrus brachyistius]